MNIRDMRIGLRLGLGFGMILLAASILLVGTGLPTLVGSTAMSPAIQILAPARSGASGIVSTGTAPSTATALAAGHNIWCYVS